MKTLWTILAVAGCGVALLAQTNSSSKPKLERGATHIDSVSMEFEYLQSLTVRYMGNVKVNDPLMQLTCELLTARFQTNNGQLEIAGIVAETNVVIDAVDWEGRTNHAVADKLVYSYSVINGTTNQTVVNGITNQIVVNAITNQSLQLSGNAWLTNYSLNAGFSGEPIYVDLVKGKVFARDPKMTIQSDAVKSLGEGFEGKKKQSDNQSSPEQPK